VLRSVLSEARELLRAERSEVAFIAEGSIAAGVRVTDGPGGLTWEKTPADPIPEWLWLRVVRRMTPTLLTRSTKREQERSYLVRRGWRDAVVVPLRGESGAIGALVVADRMGNVRTFDAGDVQLLETVANHAAIALRNGTLIDQLTHEALHDSLTGLPNRAFLQRRLSEALAAASDDHGQSVAVMIMDLDGFKDVNDTLGHHSGDDLLVEVARRMTSAAGEDVTVARLGGDEFAVLLPEVRDATTAVEAGERLLLALEPPVTLADIDVQIRASVGAAVTGAKARTAMSELLKQADVAMYAAKVRGGGVRLYEPAMSTSSPEQLALVAELRRAIAEDQLSVFFQPKVSISSGRVCGVEALVRWHHPRHGLLLPASFVPVAERSGLIQPLTTVVMRRAVAACSDWHRHGIDMDVAVNLSARSLDDPRLGDSVAALLDDYGLPADQLTLEITEDSVMADAARTIHVLDGLHTMGVRLSVDDFGTGYSSLSYLSRLPVDEVKIDRSFVANIDSDSHDQTIVRAIADLAGNLSLDVVAEGVEDAAVYDRLQEFGCDLAQGYHIGRPMPLTDLLPWLSAYRPDRGRKAALRR
jgi:diguanylate cyclase (GGDEF)-like protein